MQTGYIHVHAQRETGVMTIGKMSKADLTKNGTSIFLFKVFDSMDGYCTGDRSVSTHLDFDC